MHYRDGSNLPYTLHLHIVKVIYVWLYALTLAQVADEWWMMSVSFGLVKVKLGYIMVFCVWFWNMGLDPSSGRQDCCLWQHVSPTYSPDSLYSSCNYCWSTTPSWLSTAVAAAHPNKTAPLFSSTWHGWAIRKTRPEPLYASIRGLPKDWRRRPGRPRRTWLRTMEADLQPLNHGLNSAWRLAQDRERWKQLVETATLHSGACPRWWWSAYGD